MTAVPNWFRLLTFALFFAAIAGWIAVSNETFCGSPGRQGDDVYFENIAYHLAKGEGIKYDFTDEHWRRPYHVANQAGQNDWIFYLQVRGVTTSRSPGFPLLVAGVYKAFGRNWTAVRVVVAMMLAAGLTLLIDCVVKYQGWLAGMLACATLLLDFFILQTAGQFMTEGLGTVVICLLFCAIIHLTNQSPITSRTKEILGWIGVGLIYGLGILVRANLNGWFALIMMSLAAMMLFEICRRRPVNWLTWPAAGFCAGVIVVAGPWWARNCVVTKAFAPFGTSGSFGIVGGYCDAAYANGGNWDPVIVIAAQQQTLGKPGILDKSLAEQEYEMGKDSNHMAQKWISENREKLPLLMFKKAVSHLGFYRHPLPLVYLNALMFFGALIGCYASRKSLGFWVVVFVMLSVVTTMLTWSHYGRYSIPIRPLIHVACAVGTIVFWKFVLGLFNINPQVGREPK